MKLGGDERNRTADLPRARRTLYQLSYIPKTARKITYVFISFQAVLGKTYQLKYNFLSGGPKST